MTRIKSPIPAIIVLALVLSATASMSRPFRPSNLAAQTARLHTISTVLLTRGGSDVEELVNDDDEEFYSAEEGEEEQSSEVVASSSDETSLVSKLAKSILKLITHTIKALLGSGSPAVDLDNVDKTDMSTALATLYELDVPEETTTILGGSMKEAVSQAKTEARLVVVFVPCRSHSKNKLLVSALLSPEVTSVAEKRFKKSDTGRYLVYTSQKIPAIKGLKTQGGRPTLFVMDPITKTVLVQHHCSPPPDGKKLALWLKTLTKRHKKQFLKLQKLRQEKLWNAERTEAYKTSQVADTQQKTKREEERIEAEKAAERAKQHLLEIQQRRRELRESLGPEAASGKTIALSYNNNRYQRKFAESALLNDVFDWADVVLEREREGIVFQSLQEKFIYGDERTLEEAGLKQLVLFRVLDRKTEAEAEAQ